MNEAVLLGGFVSQNLCDGVTVYLGILPLVRWPMEYTHSSSNTNRWSDLTPIMRGIFRSDHPCLPLSKRQLFGLQNRLKDVIENGFFAGKNINLDRHAGDDGQGVTLGT